MQNKPKFVDTHCHLDLYPDMDALMQRCNADGIATIAVTTTPRAWPRNRDIARRYEYVEPALGLHPQLVGDFPSEIGIWESYFSEARVIGEVGLDASPKYYQTLEAQKKIFARVLHACAEAGDKVLTVHSVRTAKIVLDMVETYLARTGCTVILHWFTGSLSEAQRGVELGCYFSINSEMLRNPLHRMTIKSLPLEKLLTETDGPFSRRNGLPCVPSDVSLTISQLAALLDIHTDLLNTSIIGNYVNLFSRSNYQAKV